MKDIVLLGATGSIGENTLEVIRQHRDKFHLKAIVANTNAGKLAEIANEFKVSKVYLVDEKKKDIISNKLNKPETLVVGYENTLESLKEIESDVVISAIVGVSGLVPTMMACQNTKVLGLANKESIVCGGNIFLGAIKKLGVELLPLDSEHNAIFQIFEKDNFERIKDITLTASGGPFLGYKKEELKSVNLQQALKHPNWAMGAKNTIDSATLMNKGLEVIEACYLFGLDESKVKVVVHPQSIVHGMINYDDGSTLANLSLPNMQVPISYALDHPKRIPINHEKLDLAKIGKLDFVAPDTNTFPLLEYAYESFRGGINQLITLNIANEVAVEALLNNKMKFFEIPEFVYDLLSEEASEKVNSFNDIVAYSIDSRRRSEQYLKEFIA